MVQELSIQKYFKRYNTVCARYSFQGTGQRKCFKDLLPIQSDKAKEIIEQANKVKVLTIQPT